MRPMLQFVKDRFGDKELIGVEVGIWKGENSRNIMENLNIKICYFIDPFNAYTTYNGRFFDKKYMLVNLIFAMIRLEPFDKHIHIIIKTSKEGSLDVDNNLDFVYIDGNHSYKNIKEDIKIWFEKVVSGGVFGGDDYHIKYVKRAVDEFVKKYNKKLYIENYGDCIDWWIVK